jgi:phosphoadenosine phosphosulfate reductase
VTLSSDQIKQIEQASSPASGIELLCQLFPGRVVFSSSLGQEDQVLTDIIFRNDLPVKLFTLDTGRLFNEHYELLERVNARYKKSIEVYFPDAKDVEEFVTTKGVNSFYESVENRKACCFIRKVKPLERALQGAAVWITGIRSGQSENRKDLPLLEWVGDKQLYKYNPLLQWSYADVIDYIREFYVPYNPLHDKGFTSIGCAPCTRAIEPGEDPRAGRWWWETSQKECGLHTDMVPQETNLTTVNPVN